MKPNKEIQKKVDEKIANVILELKAYIK